MTEFVELYFKRIRGWPWPEDSWGLTPMFGDDGWCKSCGVPLKPQSGSLVLQRKGMKVEGAWIPYWRYDALCLSQELAAALDGQFRLETMPVAWHGQAPGDAVQVVVRSVGEAWFDRSELEAATTKEHGSPGARCADCGTWRWYPLNFSALPTMHLPESASDEDIIASPEWFGDGWNSFRQILVRKELAQHLAKASPRDFKIP